jgi:hypothetical protein
MLGPHFVPRKAFGATLICAFLGCCLLAFCVVFWSTGAVGARLLPVAARPAAQIRHRRGPCAMFAILLASCRISCGSPAVPCQLLAAERALIFLPFVRVA